MRTGGHRQDAVPKIENERPIRERLQYVIDCRIERLSAADQYERIEVSLHGNARLDLTAGKSKVHAPIQSHCIDWHGFKVMQQVRAGITWKTDYFCRFDVSTQLFNNTPRWFDTPPTKFLFRQDTCPGIEYLNGIGSCLQLLRQIFGRCLDQDIDQRNE